jgi:hypothetical protein
MHRCKWQEKSPNRSFLIEHMFFIKSAEEPVRVFRAFDEARLLDEKC